ncbi:MAG: hypothetical protein HF976_00365 [ANME-2 cluster archaeon]|nr:hypothetical protein [ANME-2 cluster archaeon]
MLVYMNGGKSAPSSPHTTRVGGAYRSWHPGRVKMRGQENRSKDGGCTSFRRFLKYIV